tara:strand:- start:28 stop:324 length:297 start_codon:yes stop_codon:yes gene_type:complete
MPENNIMLPKIAPASAEETARRSHLADLLRRYNIDAMATMHIETIAPHAIGTWMYNIRCTAPWLVSVGTHKKTIQIAKTMNKVVSVLSKKGKCNLFII